MNARPFAILLAALLCAAAPARAQVSPTTGAEVPSGRFLPVLVSVGHGYGTARTLYWDESGREVLLEPGKTWIALFPANASLIFE